MTKWIYFITILMAALKDQHIGEHLSAYNLKVQKGEQKVHASWMIRNQQAHQLINKKYNNLLHTKKKNSKKQSDGSIRGVLHTHMYNNKSGHLEISSEFISK